MTSNTGAAASAAVRHKRTIPFVDLRAQHEEVRAEIEAAFKDIVDRSSFIGGTYVSGFEKAFAEYCGTTEAVGVASGTDAVRIALQTVGVHRDDIVVTVSHTFIATAEAVTQLGARPAFVDVEPGTFTMDPAALLAFLEGECGRDSEGVVHKATHARVSAILPVHLYGQSADMAPILDVAEGYGLPVVEDACQAHGASYRFPDGRVARCGAMGAAAAFSFYPGKNLGAMGEGGAVTTNDRERARHARVLRDHGQRERYVHETAVGGNARLDAIQSAVLSAKLTRLDDWNSQRRRAAARYGERLRGAEIGLPVEAEGRQHVYHLYVVQTGDRDGIRAALGESGVATGLHYPIPVHLQDAYADLGYAPGSLPVTEAAAEAGVSLPMFPHLKDDMVDYVSDALLNVLKEA